MLHLNPAKDLVPSLDLLRRAEFPAIPSGRIDLPQAAPLLSGQRILMLGFSRQDGMLLGEVLTALGARDVAKSEQVFPLGLGQPASLRYDGIMVNVDRFADLDVGVDCLMRFRRGAPDAFVVMATGGVASDDFGHHRRAICDSTLRLPLTASRATEALESAFLNHRSCLV